MSTLLSIAELKVKLQIPTTLEICHRLRDGTIPAPMDRWGPPTWNREEVERAVARGREGSE
ncbi:MAG: hypothetical protein Q8S00_01440 [Deltaproteobacteria bacterium]|nr:hypothetical protein [Deltaproteobacteria bacterium]